MSDYIYGSSLRAAKSKANYLFEGDFRRRPNQNLSGASRSVARVELLRQAAEQRQTREDTRHKENASIRIQSIWRAYRCRKQLALAMRSRFDDLIRDKLEPGRRDNDDAGKEMTQVEFNETCREFLLFYHSRQDEQRFIQFIDLMKHSWKQVLAAKKSNVRIWLFRVTKLLRINLTFMDTRDPQSATTVAPRHLNFLEYCTRPGDILDKTDSSYVWPTLIQCRYYSVMSKIVTAINGRREAVMDQSLDQNKQSLVPSELDKFLVELIRRSLDVELPSDSTSHSSSSSSPVSPAYSFFEQFLHGPIESQIENFYFSELLRLEPHQLRPKSILRAFTNVRSRLNESRNLMSTNTYNLNECKKIIWLCYVFVAALHTRVDDFDESEKVDYINIIAALAEPAEYITSVSALLADNKDPDDQGADEDDTGGGAAGGLNVSSQARHQSIHQHHHSETHQLIKKLIELINELHHINSLKAVIFSDRCQAQVQGAIVQICSLMLSHEYLAIFNCRLLYTVAFSKEFSRSLWKSIMTTSTSSLYGSNQPIYQLIARGSQSINYDSWKMILPRLRLFCSLCSYLLPTLGDDEFYTNDTESNIFSADVEDKTHHHDQHHSQAARTKMTSATSSSSSGAPSSSRTDRTAVGATNISGSSISSFYIDRELIGISATLRDLCVGLVEILYQRNRQLAASSYQASASSFGSGLDAMSATTDGRSHDERSRLLSFEIKSSFQALVRLVCQLHARDSRKQFCPDGHWTCPSVIIPANKAVNFQMVTSQQGRLLNQITRDKPALSPTDGGHLTSGSSEIKTVLILQEIPFVISFYDRVQIFHQLLQKERQIHRTDRFYFGLPGTAISVQIRRNYIYEDAFEKLSFDNEPNMKLPLKVSLVNAVGADEAGIDGGGLTKEFLDELLKAGFDPMRGFFKYTKDHFLYPNPSANVLFSNLREGYEVHYEFLGRMLGKAIFEKIMVELPMASFFLAKLLAVKHSSDVDLHNLESLDPVLYKNLVYLKNYKGDVADLNLDFTISNNELDEHEVVELKPNGSKTPVTRENKIEYVHLVADYRLNKQIRLQCAAFKRGLAQLVDLDWLRMFDPRELQILISGAPTEIDVADWRRNTIYGNGYSDSSKAIQVFWQVVSRFDENQKRKLLRFATSCSLPPLLGFKDLVPQFAIAPAEEDRLPSASTCMNLLKLPQCEDEKIMYQKLLYAVESNSGFELS